MSEPNKLSGNSCLSCDEARVFLPLAVEDELDSVRTNLLFAHLDDCGECETAYAELADERHWIAENLVKAPALPAGFAAKVCDRIIEEGLVGEAPAETADSEAGQAAEIVVSSTSWRDFLPWATAAAMALFFVLIAGLTRDRAELPLDPAEVAGGSAPSALDVDTVSSKKSAGAHLVSLVKSSSPITESCEDLDTAPLAKDGSFADERVIRSSEFCSLDSGTPKSAFQGSSFAAKEQCTEIDPIFLASDEPEPEPGLGLELELETDAVEPAEPRWAARKSFGGVYVLTSRLAGSAVGDVSLDDETTDAEDPCVTDPNKDGEIDYRDVTHMCQVLMQPALAECSGHQVVALAGPSLDSADCVEEDCI